MKMSLEAEQFADEDKRVKERADAHMPSMVCMLARSF